MEAVKQSPSHLLDDLVSHRLYEVPLGGIHGAGKQEVLPNLETHEPLSVHLSNYAFTHRSQYFKGTKDFQELLFVSNLVPDLVGTGSRR